MPKDIAKVINSLAYKWKITIAPFLSKYKNDYCIFGTGFIVRFNSSYYLVTALHVLEDALKNEAVVIKVNNNDVLFEKLLFCPDKENDIAVANIDDLLARNDIKSIIPINLSEDFSSYMSTNTYLLMGYPSSKNKLKPLYNKFDKMIYSFTVPLLDEVPTEISTISDPIHFTFTHQDFLSSELEYKVQAPNPYGMSGGPAFELMYRKQGETTIHHHVKLVGILVEWHKNKQTIIAASSSSLLKVLKKLEGLSKSVNKT